MAKVTITLRDEDRRFAELRAKVVAGLEQLDRGEGREWNVADVKARGRAILESRRAT